MAQDFCSCLWGENDCDFVHSYMMKIQSPCNVQYIWPRCLDQEKWRRQIIKQKADELNLFSGTMGCSFTCAQLHLWIDPVTILIRGGNAVKTVGEVKDKGVCDASCITAGVDQGLGIIIKVLLSLLGNGETCPHSKDMRTDSCRRAGLYRHFYIAAQIPSLWTHTLCISRFLLICQRLIH